MFQLNYVFTYSSADVVIREPSISELYWNMYVTPFKMKLWIAISAMLCVVALMLWFTGVLSHRIDKSNNNYYNFYNSAFAVLGIFCSQGNMLLYLLIVYFLFLSLFIFSSLLFCHQSICVLMKI